MSVVIPRVRNVRQGTKRGGAPRHDHRLRRAGARIATKRGSTLILVGDSLAMVVLGYTTPCRLTVDEWSPHGRRRRAHPRRCGRRHAGLSYTCPWTTPSATPHGSRAGAEAVQARGGSKRVEMGRPSSTPRSVMAHLGLTPRRCTRWAGQGAGQGEGAAPALVDEAHALEAAGVSGIVLEGCPTEVAAMVTNASTCRRSASGPVPLATARCSCTTTCSGAGSIDPEVRRRYANLKADAIGRHRCLCRGCAAADGFPPTARATPERRRR